MKTNSIKETQGRALVEAEVITKGTIVKLGLDVHARQITVCRQLGDCTPQPAQAFTPGRLLGWVKKMIEVGAVVHSRYEAGVMGYTLHRELAALMHCIPACLRWAISSAASAPNSAPPPLVTATEHYRLRQQASLRQRALSLGFQIIPI